MVKATDMGIRSTTLQNKTQGLFEDKNSFGPIHIKTLCNVDVLGRKTRFIAVFDLLYVVVLYVSYHQDHNKHESYHNIVTSKSFQLRIQEHEQ